MGREARAWIEYAGRSGEAKALLEGDEVVLRAPVSMRIPRTEISDLAQDGDDLTGRGPEGSFRLSLGAAEAGKWKAALEKPAPTLAQKLGLKGDVAVWTSGAFDTPELAAAFEGVRRTGADVADLRLVRAESLAALMRGLEEGGDSAAPVWIIHGKGRQAALGDNVVREAMRGAGYVDVKASAVSATLSATRYVKR